MLNNVRVNVVITSRLFGIVPMHYVNYFSGTSWCTEKVSWIVIYIMCRVMYCLSYFCIKALAYICKVFIKFIHYFVFICTTVSFCCYEFIVHCIFFSAF